MKGNRITLKDVAEACSYTVNTVSRALRDDPRLPPATRTKIRQTAVTMGYIRNFLASTLRSGKSGNVAVTFRDEVSYPVMLALEEKHIAIPRDISIVSFDHLRGEIPYLPRLTSIYADGESVAVHGVRLLLNRIADRSLPPQVTVLPVRLFDEGTTAPPVKS